MLVEVGYKINHVGALDTISGTFEINFKLFIHYLDPGVIGAENGILEKTPPADPKIVVTNDCDLEEYYHLNELKNSETGHVKSTTYYRGSLHMLTKDLRMFPFDTQNLQICLRPRKKDCSSVELQQHKSERAMCDKTPHEWDLHGHCVGCFRTNKAESSSGKEYPCLVIFILAQRQHGWFVINIMVPSLSLVLIALITFFFYHDDVASRMKILVALLLLQITTKLTVTDNLPKVPYRTFIDKYMDLCFYYTMSIGIEFVIVSCLDPNQQLYFNAFFGIFSLSVLICHHCYHAGILSVYWGTVNLWKNKAQEMSKGKYDSGSDVVIPISKLAVLSKVFSTINNSNSHDAANSFQFEQNGFVSCEQAS